MLDLSGFFSFLKSQSSRFWSSEQRWSSLQGLAPDQAGTLQTLQVMRWLVRRDYKSDFVSKTVLEILWNYRFKLLESIPAASITKYELSNGRPGVSPVDPLFSFARDQIKFVEDEGPNGEQDVERVADFQRTTELGWGDCDDKVTWLATGLLNQGIPVRFRVQSYTGESWDHVYLEFWSWQRWTWEALDPTADGHGNSPIARIGWRQRLPITGKEMIHPI